VIKPIETIYKGYRFRSRLEARWAIFFQEIGLKWQYEIEGFEGEGFKYLPDFYLPTINTWIEIKPFMPDKKEINKLSKFTDALHTDYPEAWQSVYLIIGNPYIDDYCKEYELYPVTHDGLYKLDEYFIKCFRCNRIIISKFDDIGWEYPYGYYCNYCDYSDRNTTDIEGILKFHKGDWMTTEYLPMEPIFTDAYLKARQARFEHGEQG
jgi:hypothetical protein